MKMTKRVRRAAEGRIKLPKEDRLILGLEGVALQLLAVKGEATSYELWKEYESMLREHGYDMKLSPARESFHEALIRLRDNGYVASHECTWRKRIVSKFRLTRRGVEKVLGDIIVDYITEAMVAERRPALPSGKPRLIVRKPHPILEEGRLWPWIGTANLEVFKSLVNNYFDDVVYLAGLDLLFTEDEIAQLAKLSEDFRALLIFELLLYTRIYVHTYPNMPVTSILLSPLMLKRSEDEELSPFARSLISSMTEEDEELLVQLVKSTLTRIRAQLERLLKVLDEQEKLLTNLTKRKRASQER